MDNIQITYNDIDNNYSEGFYGDYKIIIMKNNGYINATYLCNKFLNKYNNKKRFREWKRNIKSKEIINQIALDLNIPVSKMMILISEGQNITRGTYVHPILIPNIISWISSSNEVKIFKILMNIIMNKFNIRATYNIDNRMIKFNSYELSFIMDIDNEIWISTCEILNLMDKEYDIIMKYVSDENIMDYDEIKIKGFSNRNDTFYINECGIKELLENYQNEVDDEYSNFFTINKFRKWIINDVYPSIHKMHGYYKRQYEKIEYDISDYYEKSVLYLIYITEDFYKFGITDNLENRLKTHKRELKYNEIVRLWDVSNFSNAKRIEKMIKNNFIMMNILTSYNNKTEIIKVSDNFNEIINLIEREVVKYEQHIILQIEREKQKTLDKEIKLFKLQNNL